MYKTKPSVYLIIALLFLQACKPEDTATPINPDLLFQKADLLEVELINLPGNDLPAFNLTQVNTDLLFLGIFNETPKVENGVLLNEQALIWSWKGEGKSQETVSLKEGNLSLEIQELIDRPECFRKNLYWAAWGWTGLARQISHSTSVEAYQWNTEDQAKLEIQSFSIVANPNNGQYIIPGREVTLRVFFQNVGNQPAEEIDILIDNPAIENLPLIIKLDSIPVGETVAKNISFNIPESSFYQDLIDLSISINYNKCLLTQEEMSLTVNGENVCLKSVKLQDIYKVPTAILWDPGVILPIFFDPDIYFLLFTPSGDWIYRSIVIEDANTRPPFSSSPFMADWPAIDPCIPLDLTGIYRLEFYDEDLDFLSGDEGDDYIGEYLLSVKDFLISRDSTAFVTSDDVGIQLEFVWGN